MGQRHQLFVIAKVNGRYRTLAAVHHQWLYGMSAVIQCRNILRIFRAECNRPGLRQDLQAASKYDFDSLPASDDAIFDEVAFPFITTCLALGASLDADTSYSERIHVLPINIAYDECSNDDGISIYDITDLGNPRFGFCFTEAIRSLPGTGEDGDEDEDADGGPFYSALQILTSGEYARNYHTPEEQRQMQAIEIIAECDSFELLSTSALKSVWPNAECNKGVQETKAMDTSGPRPPASLRERALAKVLDEGFENSSDDVLWLSQAEELPDFLPALKKRFGAHPELIDRPSGMALLSRTLQGAHNVDLTPFCGLKVAQLLAISKYSSSDPSPKALYLPEMQGLDTSVLKDSSPPHISRPCTWVNIQLWILHMC